MPRAQTVAESKRFRRKGGGRMGRFRGEKIPRERFGSVGRRSEVERSVSRNNRQMGAEIPSFL